MKRTFIILILLVSTTAAPLGLSAQAQPQQAQGTAGIQLPFVDVNIRPAQGNQETALALQLLLLLTVLSLVPSIIILLTAFVRIAIVFDFVKRALSLQQMPPNQVLMGIALFLTVFIMWPTLETLYNDSFQPFAQGEIGIQEMVTRAETPVRLFMYRQMQSNPSTIRTLMSMRNLPKPNTLADVPTYVLIPAFALHEMEVAFKIGILLFIPFIVIDLIVASTLMAMGMIMLPPVMISMPFKLILFILVGGWDLLTQQVVRSFL